MLSEKQIRRFQEIWAKRFGREIFTEEADREGGRIVRLIELFCKPATAGESEDIQKCQEENKQQ